MQGRLAECDAACVILDVYQGASKASHQELLQALALVKEHWHHIRPSLKGKVAEHHLVFLLQAFQGAHAKEDSWQEMADAIVDAIIPCSTQGSVDFDGENPCIAAASNELTFLIDSKFDPEDNFEEPSEKELPYREMAKASLGDMGTGT